MKQPETNKLAKIITMIRNSDTRWEGLVKLKDYDEKISIKDLIHYCNDSLWVIRWAIIEKVGDLRQQDCIDIIFEKLSDKDAHVRKTVKKTIIKCTRTNIQPLVKRICSINRQIGKFCQQYVTNIIAKNCAVLEPYLYSENWMISNKLLHLIFLQKKEEATSTLLKAIKINNIQKNAIMMLAVINHYQAVPFFMVLYSTKKTLRNHIIKALLIMKTEQVIPKIIECLNIKILEESVKEVLVSIGKPAVPYMIKEVHNKAHINQLLECLKKCTLSVNMYELLETTVKKDKALEKSIVLSEFNYEKNTQ